MSRRGTTMTVEEQKAILSALSPEVLAERQRIVDVAVRAARNSGHCDTFNAMLSQVMPEMCVEIGGYPYAFNTDGHACNGHDAGYIARHYGDRSIGGPYGPDGYNLDGWDRDGFNRTGYSRDGYDAEGWSASRDRDGYHRTGYKAYETYVPWSREGYEDMDLDGYNGPWFDDVDTEVWNAGRYVYLNRDGQSRIGREANETDDDNPTAFNPTTWQPEAALVTA